MSRRRTVAVNGVALRTIRTRTNVTVAALAAAIDCRPNYLYKLETGTNRAASSSFVDDVAAFLDVDPAALLADPYGVTAPDTDPDGDDVDEAFAVPA